LYFSAARVWSPYKELLCTVEAAIQRKQPDALQDLEVAIRKHKADFISLLQNPVRYIFPLVSSEY
jgi:nuclear pore complex protein Nup205